MNKFKQHKLNKIKYSNGGSISEVTSQVDANTTPIKGVYTIDGADYRVLNYSDKKHANNPFVKQIGKDDNGSKMYFVKDEDSSKFREDIAPALLSRNKNTGRNYIHNRASWLDTKQKFQLGGEQMQSNAELSNGEVYQTPNGDMNKIADNAPTHEQGGVDVNVPNGTRVYGNMQTNDNTGKYKEVANQLMEAKSQYESYAERYQKNLTKGMSPIERNTNKLMLSRYEKKMNELQGQLDMLFEEQQSKNPYPTGDSGNNSNQMPQDPTQMMGENPKAFWGALIKAAPMIMNMLGGDEDKKQVDNTPQFNFKIEEEDNKKNNKFILGGFINGIRNIRNANKTPDYMNLEDFNKYLYDSNGSYKGSSQFEKGFSTINNASNKTMDMYNEAMAKSDSDYQGLMDYTNKTGDGIATRLSNRKFDINPQLENLTLQRNTSDYNMRRMAPNAMAAAKGITAARLMNARGVNEVQAQKTNTENQYLAEGEQARMNTLGMYGQMGQSKIGSRNQLAGSQASTYGNLQSQLGSMYGQYGQFQSNASNNAMNADLGVRNYNAQADAAREQMMQAGISGIFDVNLKGAASNMQAGTDMYGMFKGGK